MATPLRSEQAAPLPYATPSLLSLSGELRNQIYSYCIGSVPSYDASDVGTPYDTPRLIQRPSVAQPRAFFKRRSFFGFTQVNRLLRQEFRPLYMQTYQAHVSIKQLPPFLEAFFPKVLASSDELRAANYCGHIIIVETPSETGISDLTYVLALRNHAPELNFQVKLWNRFPYPKETRQLYLVNLLLSNDLCSLVRCHSWSYEAIYRFEVEYLSKEPRPRDLNDSKQIFTITFKKHMRRKWMDGEVRKPRFFAQLIQKDHKTGDDIDGPFMNVLFGAHAKFHAHEWFVRALVEKRELECFD